MGSYDVEHAKAARRRALAEPFVDETAEELAKVLDSGSRAVAAPEGPPGSPGQEAQGFRFYGGPTRSERLNRALRELGPSAFKIHTLLWRWRGAPARGHLPFFTIHSLSKFCRLTRPTVRVGLRELIHKGWIRPQRYNVHHKNTLFRLVAIRRVPAPS